ncbi:MAG TPA: FAD-binding oxidoreductase [Pseudorhodoplanes sp.]|nr:FAD-binding oxidoreductase [Pseudorhodoplanes sp.]
MSQSSNRIVICGAGIAGIAAAYFLTARGAGEVTIVEPGHPLSLTSDKSTEAYRNWWPGPDWQMTAFMNRSLDLIEGLARASGNRINLNRRGYVFATADARKIDFLHDAAERAATHGAGEARVHDSPSSVYVPSPAHGFEPALTGADVVTDRALIHRHFPYLADDTVALVHVRRAGWLSAQQLGSAMLEAARERGAKILRGRAVGFDIAERVRSVHVEGDAGRHRLDATHVVLAAGPMQKEVAAFAGLDLPIVAERHYKVSFADAAAAVPRSAPMMIWLDEQYLPWTEDERTALAEDADARWLLEPFPAGVHGRPDGAHATIVLFNHHGEAVAPQFPLPEPPPHYAEIALRGMSTMVPALRGYRGRPARAHIDGGYYVRTRENRPLIGPAGAEGLYVSCAFGGFGIMASCAGGELIAAYIAGGALPAYAPAFLPARYENAEYRSLLDHWGDGGQL